MNPASRIWDIPPPPGTEDDELLPINPPVKEEKESPQEQPIPEVKKEPDDMVKVEILENKEVIVTSGIKMEPEEAPTEQIMVKREKERESERTRQRSRSRDKYRRRHSKSRSRERHRRSRSRSRRRRRRYSTSRSRSRTPSYRRRRRSKPRSSRYSRSKSRSKSRTRSKSPSRYRHKSYRSRKEREKSHRSRSSSPRYKNTVPPLDADTNEVDMKIEDDEEEEDNLKDNVFKNDGSFLEMFKKLQEQQQKTQPPEPAPEDIKKPMLPTFGKRRGGKVLKTGLVQKVRQPSNEENATDAWSVYMKEVRRYKEACCDDDSKTRPLVK